MMKEKGRRAYPRLDAYHLVKYQLLSASKGTPSMAVTSIKNIGGGGVCLRIQGYLPLSSVVQLYINFPGISSPIPSLAKVVWIRKVGASGLYEAGLQFLEIDDILRDEIIKHIDSVYKLIYRKG